MSHGAKLDTTFEGNTSQLINDVASNHLPELLQVSDGPFSPVRHCSSDFPTQPSSVAPGSTYYLARAGGTKPARWKESRAARTGRQLPKLTVQNSSFRFQWALLRNEQCFYH